MKLITFDQHGGDFRPNWKWPWRPGFLVFHYIRDFITLKKNSSPIFAADVISDLQKEMPRFTFRYVLLIMALIISVFSAADAQITFGMAGGMSPNVLPGTNHIFINRENQRDEFMFNIKQVRYLPTVSAFAILNQEPFWFSAEITSFGWSEKYTIQYTFPSCLDCERALMEQHRVMEVPISIGCDLGIFDVFSGFSALFEFRHKTELYEIDGFTIDHDQLQFAWHTGVRLNLSKVVFTIRYSQVFDNYGSGRFVNGQELTLLNAPGRVVAMAGLQF